MSYTWIKRPKRLSHGSSRWTLPSQLLTVIYSDVHSSLICLLAKPSPRWTVSSLNRRLAEPSPRWTVSSLNRLLAEPSPRWTFSSLNRLLADLSISFLVWAGKTGCWRVLCPEPSPILLGKHSRHVLVSVTSLWHWTCTIIIRLQPCVAGIIKNLTFLLSDDLTSSFLHLVVVIVTCQKR